ncbi:MAG TPA: acetyl-CoA carboxylase biotin carboxylase subunit [Anaerolineae bacterium]|nr:acetyl-CoA carboxylase biotin carboxylase subunit [Anaerolineae bacterium]HQH38998.1 acetyl-CoA carboxylase biotin carboxylase subunit [Anaerolineae bacterium]
MKVLVANRGEIAVRLLRACRDLGVPSVAVYSAADREALHTRYADEAIYLGPTPAAQSYLSIQAVIAAAEHSGANAIHPGYGFLAENADFARAVEDAGLIFIGPRPETIAIAGNKLAARRAARDAGLPVLPGPDAPLDAAIAADMAAQVQYPVLVKATAGGGGRGIRLARNPDELVAMVTAARKEAQAAFGDDTVYLEPLVQCARHIEVQILGDGAGRVLCLGERECSIQRRRQKLIEEAPAHGLRDAQRAFLYDAAARVGRALNYRSLGTVEFLLDDLGAFHFIEINPRIQVEHPVTEMVTGLDLVKEQLRLAAGRPLRYSQDVVELRGAAIEARVLAEDPAAGFLPTTGGITHLKEPGGPGIRVDSALYPGMTITADYDSLLAKVIAWGENRAVAILRLRRALQELQIGGLATDLEFLLQIVESRPFQAGNFDTTYLDRFSPPETVDKAALERNVALAAALLAHRKKAAPCAPTTVANAWRIAAWREQM